MASGLSSETGGMKHHVKSTAESVEKRSVLVSAEAEHSTVLTFAKNINLPCGKDTEHLAEQCDYQDSSELCQPGESREQNVEGSSSGIRLRILNLQHFAREKITLWTAQGDIIQKCKVSTENHVAQLVNEVKSLANDAPSNREQQLPHHEGQGKRSTIQDLLADVADIGEAALAKLSDLQRQAADALDCLVNVSKEIETIIQDESSVIVVDPEAIAALTNPAVLGQTVDEGAAEEISHAVQSIGVVKDENNEQNVGKIIGYGDRKWTLLEKVTIPQDITEPGVAGLVGDDVIITDWEEGHTYALNICGKTTRKVVPCEGASLIVSCALMADGTIACGSHTETSQGSITFYDREWKSIKDIAIPSRREWSWIDIAFAHDGLIIAVQDHCDLYVIDPAKDEIISTITCTDEILLRGAMTSGSIIAQPSSMYNCDAKLLLIDRRGNQSEIVHDKAIVNCAIDPATDDLYLLYWNQKGRNIAVDQLARDGAVKGTELFSFRRSKEQIGNEVAMPRWSYCHMTSSGKIIVFDGRSILIFKQKFIF